MNHISNISSKSLILTITMLLSAGCGLITILPDHGDDDVYFQNKKYLEKPGKIVFIETTAKEIMEMRPNEIYLFSTWCPYCFDHLSQLTPESKGTTKYIAANYDIRFMSRKFTSLDTIYILSNAAYGSIESQKIMSFATELTNQPSLEAGLPERFLMNGQNGKYERVNVK